MKKRMLVCLLMMLLAVFSVAAAEETRIPVAENDRLALSLSVDLCGFEVLDKQTGVTWSSSMNDPTFTGKLAGLNQKKANSLLTVNVTNLAKGAGSITNAVLLNESQLGASYDLVENGVILHMQQILSEAGLRAARSLRPVLPIERFHQINREHRSIFDAIRTGKPEEAQRAAFDHLVSSWMAEWQ